MFLKRFPNWHLYKIFFLLSNEYVQSCTSCYFSNESGVPVYFLDFISRSISDLYVLSGLMRTSRILFNIAASWLLHCCLCIILSASVLQYLIQSLHLVCLYRLVLLLLIATLTGCKLQSCQSFLPFFETEHSRTWCTTCISEILLSYDQLQAAPSIDWEAITWRSP